MKKIIIICVVFCFLFGCGRSEYVPQYNPYTGTRGLEISFIENAPPSIVYERDIIPFGITLKNEGAYNIDRGILNINYQKDYLREHIFTDPTINLQGKSIYNPNGEEINKLFYFQINQLDTMSQIRESIISINACYEYGTILKTDVCIDSDIFDLLRDRTKPCRVSDESFSGQGAPVAITHLSPTMTPNPDDPDKIMPIFEITIQNVGRGNVISTDIINRYCSHEAVNRDDFNLVQIRAKLGQENLICNPAIVRLDQRGTGKTRCKLSEGISDVSIAYTSLLDVELKYGYTLTTSKEFKIHRR